jgi:hypothetical protein
MAGASSRPAAAAASKRDAKPGVLRIPLALAPLPIGAGLEAKFGVPLLAAAAEPAVLCRNRFVLLSTAASAGVTESSLTLPMAPPELLLL